MSIIPSSTIDSSIWMLTTSPMTIDEGLGLPVPDSISSTVLEYLHSSAIGDRAPRAAASTLREGIVFGARPFRPRRQGAASSAEDALIWSRRSVVAILTTNSPVRLGIGLANE